MAFWDHREMKEGTRALLIDKDKNQKWSHSSIKDVTQQDIDFFFNYPVIESMEEVYDIDSYPASRLP